MDDIEIRMVKYSPSEAVEKTLDRETMDAVVVRAMQRMAERGLSMDKDCFFCCRMASVGPGGEAVLLVFVLLVEGGEQLGSLMLWSEAEARGISDVLARAASEGSYRAGPALNLFPELRRMSGG